MSATWAVLMLVVAGSLVVTVVVMDVGDRRHLRAEEERKRGLHRL